MTDWDQVSTTASADWETCSVPAQSKVRQRQAVRKTNMLALTDARNTKNELTSKNKHEEQMAAVQAEIDAQQQAIEDRERDADLANRSRSLVVRSENFEVEQQELAQKAIEDDVLRAQKIKYDDIAEEDRIRWKKIADRKKEEAHKDEIASAKMEAATLAQERRDERNTLRDFNLRAAMTVDTTKSFCKNTLLIGGTAFVLWMLLKIAMNFDPKWWDSHEHGHQHNNPPIHEQGGNLPDGTGNPALPGGAGQGAESKPFVPGEQQGQPYEEQEAGKVKGADGEIYEYTPPTKPIEHSGEGKAQGGEDPNAWGWDKYFPPEKLKTPQV